MWPLFAAMWVAMSALMVLTMYNDILRALLVHGKVRQDAQLRHSGILGTLLRIEMRKSGWIYFYLVGAMYNLGIAFALVAAPHHDLVQRVLAVLRSPVVGATRIALPAEIRPDAIAVIALLGVQDVRRFVESATITEFGDAKMHVALMGAGLVHYLGVAPAVLSSPQSRAASTSDRWHPVLPILPVLGLILFVYGSYQQYRHNRLLAHQKRANGGKHVLPRGGWFDSVLCPLYSAELLIYFAFALVCGLTNPMVNLIFVWVALNQSICARFGKQWYQDKFRSHDKLVKWALIPGVF